MVEPLAAGGEAVDFACMSVVSHPRPLVSYQFTQNPRGAGLFGTQRLECLGEIVGKLDCQFALGHDRRNSSGC